MSVQDQVRLIAQGRQEFTLSKEFYESLDNEIQQELDRNYWRFSWSKEYQFKEMTSEEKEHFSGQEMNIHYSIH